MKSALARKPITPIPEPQSRTYRSAIEGAQKAENAASLLQRNSKAARLATMLRRIVEGVAGWLIPGNVREEIAPAVDAREVEALERHIRRFTEKHRFTGFPC